MKKELPCLTRVILSKQMYFRYFSMVLTNIKIEFCFFLVASILTFKFGQSLKIHSKIIFNLKKINKTQNVDLKSYLGPFKIFLQNIRCARFRHSMHTLYKPSENDGKVNSY